MNLTAADLRGTAATRKDDAEAKTLAWLSSLPAGKPATRKEGARLAEYDADRAAGVPGRSHDQIMADVRARSR